MNKKKIISLIKIITSITLLIGVFWLLNKEVSNSEKEVSQKKEEEIRLNVALVNEDEGVAIADEKLHLASNYITKVEKNEAHEWFVVSRGIAESGLKNGNYHLVVTIPSNFSAKLLEINVVNPEQVNVNYKINANGNAEIENISNKVGAKIVQDLDKQLVDMYIASVLDNLYTAQTNIGRVARNQQEYVFNYRDTVFQPAVDFQHTIPNLISQSEGALQSNDGLTGNLETYLNTYSEYIESQKAYDMTLEELLEQRAQGNVTYSEYIEMLSQMDANIRSEETDEMFLQLSALSNYYHSNLSGSGSKEALDNQIAQLKQQFMGTDGTGSSSSLVTHLKANAESLNLTETEIRERLAKTIKMYFTDAGTIGTDGEVRLKDLLSPGDVANDKEPKSTLAEQEIQDFIDLMTTYNTDLTQEITKQKNELTQMLNQVPYLNSAEIPNEIIAYLTDPNYPDANDFIELTDNLGRIVTEATKLELAKDNTSPEKDKLGREFVQALTNLSNGLNLGSSISATSVVEYDLKPNLAFNLIIEMPEVATVKSITLEGTALTPVEGTNPVSGKDTYQISGSTAVASIAPEKLSIEYELTALPRDLNEQIKIEGVFYNPSVVVPPAENDFLKSFTIDYSLFASSEYSTILKDVEVAKMNFLKVYENVANVLEMYKPNQEFVFNANFFDGKINDIVEDIVYQAVIGDFNKIQTDYTALIGEANVIEDNFDNLSLTVVETANKTSELQEQVAAHLAALTNLKTNLTEIFAFESNVASAQEESDSRITNSKETMVGLLENSQSIREISELNIEESTAVKDVFLGFNEDVESVDSSSEALALSANTVMDKLETELKNNNNFYDSFSSVMSSAHHEGVPNENLLKFLANPVKGASESAVKSAEVYKPFTWILMMFAVTIFAAYVFATENLGQRAQALFEQKRVWITHNIFNTVLVVITGIVLGVVFGIMSERALVIPQEEVLLWVLAVVLLTTVYMLLNHVLIKQFKVFGLGVSLFLLVSYVYLTNAIGKSSTLNPFSQLIKNVNPLLRGESILMSFFSQNIISGMVLVVLVLFIIIGIVLNLMIWKSNQKEEYNGKTQENNH